jgi:hypothetical protein
MIKDCGLNIASVYRIQWSVTLIALVTIVTYTSVTIVVTSITQPHFPLPKSHMLQHFSTWRTVPYSICLFCVILNVESCTYPVKYVINAKRKNYSSLLFILFHFYCAWNFGCFIFKLCTEMVNANCITYSSEQVHWQIRVFHWFQQCHQNIC